MIFKQNLIKEHTIGERHNEIGRMSSVRNMFQINEEYLNYATN